MGKGVGPCHSPNGENNFIPTDHERRVLLELLQSPQESLESIANELKITLAALTIYLATDDAASLFARPTLPTPTAPAPPPPPTSKSVKPPRPHHRRLRLRHHPQPPARRQSLAASDRPERNHPPRRNAPLPHRQLHPPHVITATTLPFPAKREVGERFPESARGCEAASGRDTCIAHRPPRKPTAPKTNPTRERGATNTPSRHPPPKANNSTHPSPQHSPP